MQAKKSNQKRCIKNLTPLATNMAITTFYCLRSLAYNLPLQILIDPNMTKDEDRAYIMDL